MVNSIHERAVFAAGCFWGVESAFRQVPGVIATAVGYAGGQLENPTYEEVCFGTSGHAEAVQVEFDPARVRYEQLLELFWRIHDPTTVNRQGPDVGSQYRSAVFYTSSEQEALARKGLEKAQQGMPRRIVTQIVPLALFWRAEEYHQQYWEKRGKESCAIH
jgi:peptide-methionine (S)-S-oxide reductase